MTLYPVWLYSSAEEPEDKKFWWRWSDPVSGFSRLMWYGSSGWEPIAAGGGEGGGIPDAPGDGAIYGRRLYGWYRIDFSDYLTISQAANFLTIEDGARYDQVNAIQNGDISTLRINLQNEISRAQQVENQLSSDVDWLNDAINQEINRATVEEGLLSGRITNLESNINHNVVISASYNATATGVDRTTRYRNLMTQIETSTVEAMPIVSNITAGIVLPDVFNTINQNTQRITNLEQSSGAGGNRRLGVFDTKAALDAYVLPSDAKAGDTAVVTNDETHSGYATEYGLNSSLAWEYLFTINTTTPIATNTSLGTIKGNTNDGAVSVETDGSMSVNGWDALKDSVPIYVSELVNDRGYATEIEINNKRDKVDYTRAVYVTDVSGIDTYMRYDNPSSGSISSNEFVVRGYDGGIQVPIDVVGPYAISETQVTNQINDAVLNKVDKTTTGSRVYGTGLGGEPTLYGIGQNINPNTIVQRNASSYILLPNNATGQQAVHYNQVLEMIASGGGDLSGYARRDGSTVTQLDTAYLYGTISASSPTDNRYIASKSIAGNRIIIRESNGDVAVNPSVSGNFAIGQTQVNQMVSTKQNKLTDVDDILFVQEVPANPNPRILYLTPIS